MKPREVTLTNFRSLTDFHYKYSPGITGIKAPNYAGKSNFADLGQKFAWPGITPTGINKKDLLNWYEDRGSTRFVFDHGECTYTLTRNIHDAKVSLTKVSGEKDPETITDSTDIRNQLEEMTGISMDLISEYCFIPQFRLTAVLQMTRSQRMDYFLRLVGGDKAAKIRTRLQGITNRVPVYRDRTDEIANNEVELKAVEKEFTELLAEKKQLMEESEDIAEKVTEANELLKYPLQSVIQQQIKDLSSKIEANKKKYNEFIKNSRLQEVKEVKPLSKEEVTFMYYKEEVEEALQISSKALDDLVPPGEVVDPEPLYKELVTIKSTYDSEKEKLKNIEKGLCPTCERPFDMSDEEIQEKKDKLLEMKEQFTEKKAVYDKRKKEQLEYLKAKEAYNNRKTQLETEIANLQKQVPSNLSLDYDALKKQQKQYEEYCNYLNAVNTNKETLEKFSENRIKFENEKESLEKLSTITQKQKNDADAAIQRKSELTDAQNELTVKIERIEERKSNYLSNLEKARKEQEECAKNEKFIEFLQEARGIFHKDNLPSLVLSDRRLNLNYHLSDYLEHLNSGFTAYVNEEFDFRVNFENGEDDRPVGDLSGGQKIMLSIVFHLAKLNLLPQVPFLVLDEPTMYLSREVISDISRILEKFDRDSQKNGQESYIIIPTHENELDSCFTRIYEMGV